MGRLVSIALGAIAAMLIIAYVLAPGDKTAEAEPVAAASAPPTEEAALLLHRDTSGQFHLTALVNGTETRFLVDTGADTVALTEETAEALGILPPGGEFQPMMETAAGVGYGAPVELDTLEVAGREYRGIHAVVAQGLNVNLLGQSVLRKLGKVELQGDRMVIRQN